MKLLINFAKYILKILPGYSWIASKNELSFYMPFSKIDKILFFLKKHTLSQFTILVDVCGVDYPMRGRFRYDVVYHILSIRFNSRLRLKTAVQELTMVPTCTNVFSSANWWEREVFDMFGIFFSNHPDLRRILTDYGFVGHPLKKDFPLMGFIEVRYDFAKKQILAENIELSQDFRQYNYENPWNFGFISSFKIEN